MGSKKETLQHESATEPKMPEGFQETTFEIWEPEIDDVLEGRYVGHVEVPQGKNGPFKAHHVERKQDGAVIACSGAMLDKALDGAEGKQVWILYRGEEELDSGNKLNYYRVGVKS